MNPDAYIATLEDGGRLEMQLTVRRGRGYASADDNKPAADHPGRHPHRLHLLAGARGWPTASNRLAWASAPTSTS